MSLNEYLRTKIEERERGHKPPKQDRREYCAECRRYHERPVWQPGRSCGR